MTIYTHLRLVAVFTILLQSRAAMAATPAFSDQTAAAGITAVHMPTEDLHVYIAGGCVADFNNDGWQDIYFCGGGGAPDCLYINNADGTFTDRAASWGIQDTHLGAMGTAGDFDGDGRIDLFVTSLGTPGQPEYGRFRLYRNMPDDTFLDVAATSGVNTIAPAPTTASNNGWSSAWGDYDLDGDLDLVVARFNRGNQLLRNDGSGVFTDVTRTSLLYPTILGSGFSPRLVDMDGDRLPELLMVSDFSEGQYYVNSGFGRFRNDTARSGTMLTFHDMGMTIADFDRDGRFDFYVTSINENTLFMNQGDHAYSEIAIAAGVRQTGWGWATISPDINHDGWPDLITTGGSGQFAFLNSGDDAGALTFEDVSLSLGIRGDGIDNGRGMANFDYDNDGDQDVVVFVRNGPLKLYRNDLSGDGDTHWLRVFLDTHDAPHIAPNGVGSVVKVTTNGFTQMGRIDGGSNYLSQSEMSAHFGLGSASIVDELRIEWTNGAVTILHDVPADQTITIDATNAMLAGDMNCDGVIDISDAEPFATALANAAAYASQYPSCNIMAADMDKNGTIDGRDIPEFVALMGSLAVPAFPMYSDQTTTAGITAAEPPPTMFLITSGCVADFNNDGWQDFYFCTGGSVPDRLYINNADGTFSDRAAEWGIDIVHAGLTAVPGDFDGDGRIDLFISSFGDPNDLRLGQNRLYRNSPNDTFIDVTDASGINVVSPTLTTLQFSGLGGTIGDYDLDGDLDLAIAQTRHPIQLLRNEGAMVFSDRSAESGVDGAFSSRTLRFIDMNGDRYPEIISLDDAASGQYLINNLDGTFSDGTDTAVAFLGGSGCTAADFDRDGLFDFFAAEGYELLYVNQGNHIFTEMSDAAGLGDLYSIRSLTSPDIDNDGWPDIVATGSFGQIAELNTTDETLSLSFQDVSHTIGVREEEPESGRSLARFDYDNDGDQDLLVFQNDHSIKLLRNDLPHYGNSRWLRVFLNTNAAPDIAPNGIGSVVKVTTGGFTQMGRIDGGSNYLSQSEMSAHFGLGAATVVDELRVEWTNGDVTIMNNVLADQTITIAAPSTPLLLGDMNCDAVVDFADLAPFALALTDASAYGATHPACSLDAADLDGNGVIDGRDIAAFVLELLD